MRKIVAITVLGLMAHTALAGVNGSLAFRNDRQDSVNSTTNATNRFAGEVTLSTSVNDKTNAVVGFATGTNNTRYVTLDDASSKNVGVNLAYVEYSPFASAKITLGKMHQPWSSSASYFVDKDINPSGLAVAYNVGHGLGLTAYSLTTAEAATGTTSDTKVTGGEAKYSGTLLGLNVGAAVGIKSYSNAVSQYVTTGTANIGTKVMGRPVTGFVEYLKNNRAATANRATAYGVTYNQAKDPGSYDVSIVHQSAGVNSLSAAWVDSEFANGNSFAEGNALVANYVVAKGLKVTGRYYDTKVGAAQTATRRLMADLSYTF